MPPRSGYAELDGLMMMPRTIDKLRAILPGGKPGEYFINGRILGLSGFLLMRLGVREDELLAVVAGARSDADVASWLRSRVDVSKYDEINAMIRGAEPRHAEDESVVREIYARTMAEHPELIKLVDILDADDRRMFPESNQQ